MAGHETMWKESNNVYAISLTALLVTEMKFSENLVSQASYRNKPSLSNLDKLKSEPKEGASTNREIPCLLHDSPNQGPEPWKRGMLPSPWAV